MRADLFAPPVRRSKKQDLLEWIQERGAVATHEVIAWGLAHYTVSAERYAQKLAQEGNIRRMTNLEKLVHHGGKGSKEDIWVAVKTI